MTRTSAAGIWKLPSDSIGTAHISTATIAFRRSGSSTKSGITIAASIHEFRKIRRQNTCLLPSALCTRLMMIGNRSLPTVARITA
ncbi:Os07g0654500, partial [Oryza sativa Japonica Group]